MSGPILPIIISFLPVKGAIKWKRWWQLKTWGLMRCGWFILRSGTADNVIGKRKLQVKVNTIRSQLNNHNEEKQRWGEWTLGPLYLVALWVPPSPFIQKSTPEWQVSLPTSIKGEWEPKRFLTWSGHTNQQMRERALITGASVHLINFA